MGSLSWVFFFFFWVFGWATFVYSKVLRAFLVYLEVLCAFFDIYNITYIYIYIYIKKCYCIYVYSRVLTKKSRAKWVWHMPWLLEYRLLEASR
jgi:hypothetical protein